MRLIAADTVHAMAAITYAAEAIMIAWAVHFQYDMSAAGAGILTRKVPMQKLLGIS